MNLACFGINYQTATLALRERFALSEANLTPALQDLQKQLGHETEVVLISTCNRFELYTSASDFSAVHAWIVNYFKLEREEFIPFLYTKTAKDLLEHAIRVASGLDSMVVGEAQILGQMKCAYAQGGQVGTVGQALGHLFPFVFAVAKRIRTETLIGQGSVSIAHTAVKVALQHFTSFDELKILLIGAGTTMMLVSKHLVDYDAKAVLLANRSLERAEDLAQRCNAHPILIRDIPEYLADIDLVISSTASQLPLLGKGMIERVMKQRSDRPLLIIDLAVPRDVEPEVAELANVTLCNIDDLQNLVETNKQERRTAVAEAEAIITEELGYFEVWQNALHSVPMICAYRQHMEKIRDQELTQALNELKLGRDPALVMQDFARKLTNKFIHHPSVEIRKASSDGRLDLLAWSQQLLGIQANESIDRSETAELS